MEHLKIIENKRKDCISNKQWKGLTKIVSYFPFVLENISVDPEQREKMEDFLEYAKREYNFEEWRADYRTRKEEVKFILQNKSKNNKKIYNMTQAAEILGVCRETMYYWIKKEWIKPKRDYRNYPVFTVLDMNKLIKWRNVTENS